MSERPPHERSAWRTPLEFLPLLVFFVANYRYGIFSATVAIVVATAVSVAVLWQIERRLPVVPLITAGFLVIFGGLTIAFDDPLFIKIKPTVASLIFAAVLAGSTSRGVLLLRYVLSGAFALEDRVWKILTWRWVGFFVFLAAVNEAAWRNLSTDDWVSFKVFGILPLTLVFTLLQTPLILRERKN